MSKSIRPAEYVDNRHPQHWCKLGVGATILTSIILLSGCTPQVEYAPPPPAKVTVAQPLRQTIVLYLEEDGETEAVERAEVRARVQGFLEEIRFRPDTDVKAGDTLYIIEQRRYRNTLEAAKASLSAAEAAVDRSELEFQREKNLLAQNATAKTKFEQARAERDTALADREAAVAAVDQAELDLEYTEVKAPINGTVTKTLMKLGNLVQDGDHLATVVSTNPIYVNFRINERDLQILQKRLIEQMEEKGISEEEVFDYRTVPVLIARSTDNQYPFMGRLDYVDAEGVDRGTGTFGLRAVLQNPKGRLLPGFFIRVRLPIGRRDNSILIPEKALLRDQAGTYVLVVDKENVVGRKNIEVGLKKEDYVVVYGGLEGDEMIVVEGLQRARPEDVVDPKTITLEPLKSLQEELQRLKEEYERLEKEVPLTPMTEKRGDPGSTSDAGDSSDDADAKASDASPADDGSAPEKDSPESSTSKDSSTETESNDKASGETSGDSAQESDGEASKDSSGASSL